MNLKEQTELIEALIDEREDYTIKDFLELKAEIENIKQSEYGTKSINSKIPLCQG